MKAGPTRTILTLIATLAMTLASVTLGAKSTSSHDPFPRLETLEGNVDFWVRVFSEWTVAQVAVHDLGYPGVVYEIVDLPGEIGERYSEDQKDYLEDLRERWSDWLLHLETQVADRAPLDEIEKEWVLHITTVAGSDALAGAHERIRTQRGLRERFLAGLERSFGYIDAIRRTLRDAGLPEDLAYLPHVESAFQPAARSSVGAQGLWQFTRGTGRHYMRITSALDERLDPLIATHGAAGYLKDAYQALGSWPLALTSYNHGVQGMRRASERFGGDFEKIYREYDGRTFGFASKNFYAEFLAARRIAREPEHYFPEGFDRASPPEAESVRLDERSTVPHLADHYGVTIAELKPLNPSWTSRAIRGAVGLPAGVDVRLPVGTLARAQHDGAPLPDAMLAVRGTESHRVRRGDTLSGIAAAYSIPVGTLRQLNDIPRGSSLIRVGQRLKLTEETRAHRVRRGQTLSGIAREHGVTLRRLREANARSGGGDVIHPGQILRIPAP